MKKTITKLLCIAMVLCMLMSFTACGLIKGMMYAGTYVLSYAEIGGQEYEADSLEILGLDPDDCYIELKADGTAELCLFGEDMDMEWEDNEIWPEGEEDEAVEFEIDGDELILENDGQKMVFVKE